MELVPIITQILLIVAAVFILVLIVSFGASRIKKKEKESLQKQSNVNIQRVNKYQSNQYGSDKSQYYGGSYSSGGNSNPSYNYPSYPREVKVVKRSNVTQSYSSGKYPNTFQNAKYNSRFTVLNNVDAKEYKKVETDELGFKIYSNNEIAGSFYMPS